MRPAPQHTSSSFVAHSAGRAARVELQLVSALEDARVTGDDALGKCIETQIDRVRVLRRRASGLLASRSVDESLVRHAERSCASARAVQDAARRCLTVRNADDGRTVVTVSAPAGR
ncbi:MAG: hypothetical protein KC503_03370 [Myxococcales bacterium]|nr:hypothetical protein [Myxococcales bacterium]